MKPEPS